MTTARTTRLMYSVAAEGRRGIVKCAVKWNMKGSRQDDTVSFGSAQIKSPFSPRNPPKYSSPLNALFFERLSRSKARKVWDDSWSTHVERTVAVTESYTRTARLSLSPCGVSCWCPSPVDLWSGALVCQTTIGDYRQWQRFILTPRPNQTWEVSSSKAICLFRKCCVMQHDNIWIVVFIFFCQILLLNPSPLFTVQSILHNE